MDHKKEASLSFLVVFTLFALPFFMHNYYDCFQSESFTDQMFESRSGFQCHHVFSPNLHLYDQSLNPKSG